VYIRQCQRIQAAIESRQVEKNKQPGESYPFGAEKLNPSTLVGATVIRPKFFKHLLGLLVFVLVEETDRLRQFRAWVRARIAANWQ
jgi:hypothetical protein